LKADSGVIIDAVLGEGAHQISLIEGARREGANPLDIFESEAAQKHPIVKPGESIENAMPTTPLSPSFNLGEGTSAGPTAALLPTIDGALADGGESAVVEPDAVRIHNDPALDDPIGSIQLVVHCRQHNPEWLKTQAKLKLDSLRAKVALLPVGTPLRIRTSSGVCETVLQQHLEVANSVRVLFPDGKQQAYTYSAIVWTAPEVPVLQKAAHTKSKHSDYIYGSSLLAFRLRSLMQCWQTASGLSRASAVNDPRFRLPQHFSLPRLPLLRARYRSKASPSRAIRQHQAPLRLRRLPSSTHRPTSSTAACPKRIRLLGRPSSSFRRSTRGPSRALRPSLEHDLFLLHGIL
jgi:hypothetical protein